jgi:Transposase.
MSERPSTCPVCGKMTRQPNYCHRCQAEHQRARRAGKLKQWRARTEASPYRERFPRGLLLRNPEVADAFRAYHDERLRGVPPRRTLRDLAETWGCHRETVARNFRRWCEREGLPLPDQRSRAGLGPRPKKRARAQNPKYSEKMRRLVAQKVFELQRDAPGAHVANEEIAELARELGIHVRTLYHWRDRYFAGMLPKRRPEEDRPDE